MIYINFWARTRFILALMLVVFSGAQALARIQINQSFKKA